MLSSESERLRLFAGYAAEEAHRRHSRQRQPARGGTSARRGGPQRVAGCQQ